MKILMLLILMFSFSILFLTHPMSLGLILLIQTILTSLIINYLNMNFWFSYIMFLIMIGGMLILFIYMTSIASNEKFIFSYKLIILMSLFLLLILMLLILDNFILNMMNNYETLKLSEIKIFNQSLNKFFNFPNFYIFYLSMIYLLITLIAIVKISNINMGPLRSKN